jgi:hypothetical protein
MPARKEYAEKASKQCLSQQSTMTRASLTDQIRDMIKKSESMKSYSELDGGYLLGSRYQGSPEVLVTFRVDFYTKKDAQAFADSVRALALDSKVTVLRTESGLFRVQFDP